MRSFVILLCLFLLSCQNDGGKNYASLAPISDLTYSSANGTILFKWKNPNVNDLAYVEISYQDRDDKTRRVLVKDGLEQYAVGGIADSNPYYFGFKVFNKEGHSSESVEMMASAKESLVNLFYGRVNMSVDFGGINVHWENEYSEGFVIELSYMDLNKNFHKNEVIVPANSQGKEYVEIGSNINGTQTIDVLAVVLDKNNNESDRKVLSFYKKEAGRLDRTNWELKEISSEQASEASAAMILDGRLDTYWHSQYQGSKPNFPHYIVIDIGGRKRVEKISLSQRAGSMPLSKGVEIWGATVDGSAADNIWTKIAEFEMAFDGDVARLQEFDFADSMIAKYIKVVFTTPSGRGDNSCAACAELYLFGYDVTD